MFIFMNKYCLNQPLSVFEVAGVTNENKFVYTNQSASELYVHFMILIRIKCIKYHRSVHFWNIIVGSWLWKTNGSMDDDKFTLCGMLNKLLRNDNIILRYYLIVTVYQMQGTSIYRDFVKEMYFQNRGHVPSFLTSINVRNARNRPILIHIVIAVNCL